MDETKEMTSSEKGEQFKSWMKDHLWLWAIIAGACILLGLCGPLLTAKGVTSTLNGTGSDAYWTFSQASSRAPVYFFNLFSSPVSWPLLLTYGLVLVGIVLCILGKKWVNCYTGALLLYLCLGIIFFSGTSLYDFINCYAQIGSEAADYIKYYAVVSSSKLNFGLAFSGAMSFVAALLCLSASNSKDPITVQDLAEMAILSALAIGLQFIKIPVGPTGGSINFGLIPLFIIALRHGPAKGFIASGLVFGLITCLTDGYGLFTFPLDYLVGFGGCAALGFFQKLIFTSDEKGWSKWGFLYIFIGVLIASLIRYLGSTVSSIVNYGYTLVAALIYNDVYIPVTGAIALGAMELLYIPLARVNKLFPVKKLA